MLFLIKTVVMTWKKLPFKPLKFALVMSVAALSCTPVQGQPVESMILLKQQNLNPSANLLVAESQEPPPGQGAPRGTKPGGSRNPCPAIQKSLTPLVLTTKQSENKELRWGYTTKANPTLWVYVPYDAQSISSSKFSLRNQAGETVYETDLNLTGTPGVISISVPSTAPPLESDQWYQWYLFVDVYCTPTTPAQQDSVDGWVKREEPNATLKTELEKATLQQQANLYAKEGFLEEALITLAELKKTNPSDDNWTKLLRDSGLEAIATEPVVDCCTPESQ